MTRIVATADIHGHLPEIPECDLLLIAGDVCPVDNHNYQFQANWLRTDFAEWLLETPAEEIVWIGGNHDFVLENMARAKTDKLPGFYLQDETIELCGLKIHGSPWSPSFGNWAFMRQDPMLAEKWALIPDDVDILMVHGPFYGTLDHVPHYEAKPVKDDKGKMFWMWEPAGDGEHVGSKSLLNRVTYSNYSNLKAFICGHIHEGYGVEEVVGKNTFTAYNVSHRDGQYEPVNPPMVIDV